MTIKKYRADLINIKITIVYVISETKNFVQIRKHVREAKIGNGYHSYFNTFTEAQEYLIQVCEHEKRKAIVNLNYTKTKLEKAHNIKPI